MRVVLYLLNLSRPRHRVRSRFSCRGAATQAGGFTPKSEGGPKEAEETLGEVGAEFRKKWKLRTHCASGFLELEGSGLVGGAGYEIEEHCRGATSGRGTLKKTLEEAKKQEEERRRKEAGNHN